MLLAAFRFLFLICAAALSSSAAQGLSHPAVRACTFIEPAPLQPEVHASTLAEVEPGVWVAAWFAGTKEGNVDVSIWGARRDAAGWGPAREIVRATGPAGEPVPAYNPVLLVPEPGKLALVHSAGWEGKPWLPFLQRSQDGGRTWSVPVRLPDGLRGPDRNKPLRLPDGGWLHPSTAAGGVHVERSDAALGRWTRFAKVADPHGFRALQPTLLDHGGGRLQMLVRTYRRELATAWSTDEGRTWTPLEGLSVALANSAIDAVRLPDGRFLLAYNPTGAPRDAKDWGPRHPISLAVSNDGRVWRRIVDLESAPIREGYAYPCLVVGTDGLAHLTYTWGRKRIRHLLLDPARLR